MAPMHAEHVISTPPAPTDFLHRPAVRKVLPFVNGGLAGVMASSLIQPIGTFSVLNFSSEISTNIYSTIYLEG